MKVVVELTPESLPFLLALSPGPRFDRTRRASRCERRGSVP